MLGWHIEALLWICIFSDELNPVCNKYLTFFAVVVVVSQNNLGICPKIFLVNGDSHRLNNNDTLTDDVAAISSSLGMEMYFKGQTLDFPISRTQ